MPQESSSAFHVHVATACHSSIFTFMLEGARYVFPGAGVRTASATTARSAAPRFPANSLHTAGPPRPAAS
jgi:DNA-binding FadR family transcriptional regulator